LKDRNTMSQAAAGHAAALLRRVIDERGQARVVAATAASQIEFQRALVGAPGIRWPGVELFQLDEYIGLPADHPPSFRRALKENLIGPANLTRTHVIDGEHPDQAIEHLNGLLGRGDLDLAFLGIGENAHLAFNDPPADFDAVDPYIIVTLDHACR